MEFQKWSDTILFTKLEFRYNVVTGNSYTAEIICIFGFSVYFFVAVFFLEVMQFFDQISVFEINELHKEQNPNFRHQNKREFIVDTYLSLRMITKPEPFFSNRKSSQSHGIQENSIMVS